MTRAGGYLGCANLTEKPHSWSMCDECYASCDGCDGSGCAYCEGGA